ncbi:Clavaminate synthase-like protein [Daldinia bambusicola]|nr:Clavaminate synthase-like protein [Daldinia bambusicola]
MATTLEQTPIRPFECEKIASPLLSFEQFDLPSSNQRILGPPHPEGTVTPLALRPSTSNHAALDLDTVIETVKHLQAQGDVLTKKLAVHGTLLFRGLPIHDANDFNEIIGIVVDRPLLAPNVAPANESPKEVLIYNHNESPQVPHAPEYVFFYGHKAPEQGGETPISSSLELFRRAQQEIPEFVDELAGKGILSKVTYKTERQYAGGSTLKQAFGKAIEDGDDEAARRAKVEAQIRRYARGPHTTWEWTADGVVLTHRLPAVRTQPGTGLPTLFTGLAAYYKNARANAAGATASSAASGRKNVTQQLYGDGTPIPEEYLAALARITDEIRVLHKWQRGDVLVYDNVVAQHGREPWQGEQSDRVVMASLFDSQVPGAYISEDWAQVVQALDG